MSGEKATVAAGMEAQEERLHDNLVLLRRGAVHILRIDREAKLGALNSGILAALGDYFGTLSIASDVRALVLTGTGRGFVAGADVGEYYNSSQLAFDNYQRRSRKVFDALAALPQITICAVNGYALGGGFELAMACDFMIASPKASFGLPEIKLGLLPGGGGTQRLTRLIGRMRAKELILSGRTMGAEEALSHGALLEVCDAEKLILRAIELAETFAANAPLALVEGKRVVDDGQDASLPSALTLEQRVLGGLFATEDGKEGIAAFVEKRLPQFVGR